MHINRYKSKLLASNMYVVEENGHAIVIDPSESITIENNFIIDWIILTHEHYDHIAAVNIWKEAFSAPVLCSRECSKGICDSRRNLARYFKEFCELQAWVKLDTIPSFNPDFQCEADVVFKGTYWFSWMDHEICLFEIPGHSQGSIGIFIDNQYFFSGDSLIPGFDIELRIPGGSKKQWESIGKHKLEKIAKGVVVYPGHLEEYILQ